MSASGLAGCTVAFVDYLKEIPFFLGESHRPGWKV